MGYVHELWVDTSSSRDESEEAAERRDLHRAQVILYQWVVITNLRGGAVFNSTSRRTTNTSQLRPIRRKPSQRILDLGLNRGRFGRRRPLGGDCAHIVVNQRAPHDPQLLGFCGGRA